MAVAEAAWGLVAGQRSLWAQAREAAARISLQARGNLPAACEARVVAEGKTTHLHFDCFSGIAGDMFLGACLDAGLPWERLTEAVEQLDLEAVTIEQQRRKRGGISGLRFVVRLHNRPVQGSSPLDPATERSAGQHSVHRSLADIRQIIEKSSLDQGIRDRALALFARLAMAEAKIHAVDVEQVHFHEVGAVDAIVDLVGAAVAYDYFKPSSVSCSAVNVGQGTVSTQHGELPVPAPAAAELLLGVPVFSAGEGEMVTPTGAVLLAELVDSFGGLPSVVPQSIGYGLGQREVAGRPNAFRLIVGERRSEEIEIMVVETEIDDLPGEAFGFLMERLQDSAALDMFFSAVQMKKNRPGTLVTVLCKATDLEEIVALLLSESRSLGCRYYPVRRFEATRRHFTVSTEYGTVRIKEGRFADRVISRSPEFEDCRKLALESGVPLQEVVQAALSAIDDI